MTSFPFEKNVLFCSGKIFSCTYFHIFIYYESWSAVWEEIKFQLSLDTSEKKIEVISAKAGSSQWLFFFTTTKKSIENCTPSTHYSLIIFKLLSRHFNGSMIKILKFFFFVCAFFLNHRRNDFRVSCQSKSTGTCHLSWHCKDKMSNEFFMLILWNFLFPEYVNILFKNEIFVFDEITQ